MEVTADAGGAVSVRLTGTTLSVQARQSKTLARRIGFDAPEATGTPGAKV